MALNFPDSPTDGQLYTDPVNGNRYTYDSANSAWKSTSTFQYNATVSSTAPGTPQQGSLWWNQDYGRLLVYYQDANTSQWVDATPSMDYRSDIFAVANAGFGKANTALQNTTGTFSGTLYTTGSLAVATNIIPTVAPLTVNNVGKQLTLMAYGGTQNCTVSFECIRSDFTGNSSALAIYTNSGSGEGERMRIDANGRIGIGTSAPASPLNIIVASPVDSSGSVGKWGIRVNDSTPMATGVGGSILFQGDKGVGSGNFGGIAGLKENSTSGNEAGYLAFYTTPNSTQLVTERMRIDSLGRVTMPYQPIFYAYGGSTQSMSGSQVARIVQLPYQLTLGSRSTSNYDTTNYRFTVPVAGTYMFMMKYCITGTSTGPESTLYVNGASQQYGAIQYSSAGYSTATSYHIWQCNANDYVEFRIVNNNATSFTVDTSRSSFAGWLLG